MTLTDPLEPLDPLLLANTFFSIDISNFFLGNRPVQAVSKSACLFYSNLADVGRPLRLVNFNRWSTT